MFIILPPSGTWGIVYLQQRNTHIPEGGRIINISSTNGLGTVSTDSMDYDASKAGVIAITKSLAKELAPKILVNSIAPGWVDTDINKYLSEDYVKSETAQ